MGEFSSEGSFFFHGILATHLYYDTPKIEEKVVKTQIHKNRNDHWKNISHHCETLYEHLLMGRVRFCPDEMASMTHAKKPNYLNLKYFGKVISNASTFLQNEKKIVS